MADMTTIKGRIAETIYPNGTGAITAESHQALLLEMVDNINEVKQDVLVSGQNIRPLISGESLLGDNALAVLGTRFVYELENQKLFAMIDGALQDLDSWMVNRAVHSQVTQVIEIQKEGHFQELVPLTIKNKAGLAALCWEYDGMIYEASMEDNVLTVVSKPKGDDFDAEGNYPLLHVGTADDLAGRGESVPASFGFRASGGKSIKDGRAYIKAIKGNSVVWNQKVKGFVSWNLQGGTIEGNEAVWSAESRTGVLNAYSNTFAQHTTHKYLISADVKASSTNVGLGIYFMNSPIVKHTGSGNYESLAIITNGKGDGVDACYLTDVDTSGYSEIRAKNYRCIDLTQMFGAGNEPSTIEEFNARKAVVEDEYAYNEGEVIHCNTESIKSVGDNAWDEEWEVGAIYSHGGFYDTTTAIRAKNFIKVLPNTEYYINRGSDTDGFLFAYDKDFQQISGWNLYGNNKSFTTPVNAEYIKFCTGPSYGPIYKNDIMITLVHSGWKQDTDAGYQPYWQDTLPLPIIRKYFPDGMKSAGTAHDEIRFNKASGKWEYSKKKIKGVDLGTMNWSLFEGSETFIYTQNTAEFYDGQQLLCAKTFDRIVVHGNGILRVYTNAYTDAATFKAAMQGVILYYESNDWEWVELDAEDQNFRDYYNVADFGTEQSQASVPSAPFSADIIYQFNAVDMIREHELEITELQKVIATMQAQLTSLINGGQ